jgi:cytochrome P450
VWATDGLTLHQAARVAFWTLVCSIGSAPVNVILRLLFHSLSTPPHPQMTEALLAYRRPPGPEQPVTLGIDQQTLVALEGLQHEFGDMVGMTQPNGRLAYFVNDASEVRRILVRRHSKYHKGPGFERVKMLLGNGLIVSDGDVWRRSRTMIQPAFSKKNVHRLMTVMVECCDRRAVHWADLVARGEDLNITEETSDFALELILISIFGNDYQRRILTQGENPFAFLSRDSTRDLSVVMKVRHLRALLMGIIEERRSDEGDDTFDFLSMYLSAVDKRGQPFSDAELLDELMTLIVAGFETSANTLNWVWYLIAKHPDIEAKLLDEAGRILPNVSAVNTDSLNAMQYTQQVLEEALRLYPPVWLFTRRSHENDELDDYDVPPGTDIYLSPYILHRTAHYWSDPDTFEPDRFAPGEKPDKDRPYFPFSLGPRRCLGEYFSFLEMKVHLGLLLPHFRMRLLNDEVPELELGINLRSAADIYLQPEERRKIA